MAKQPTSKNGTSRIRFIMLDAELPEGDLSQITSAIQNALRPTTTVIQQRLPPQTPGALPNGVQDAEVGAGAESELVDGAEEALVEVAAARPPRVARSRKPTVPIVLELDLRSGVSFETFATAHTPKNETERNLVVLAWFKEHRPDEAVTVNHVYTCYRTIGWPSGFADFSWPLRALKKEQLVTSPGRGQYAVNHIGIARVEKMGAAS